MTNTVAHIVLTNGTIFVSSEPTTPFSWFTFNPTVITAWAAIAAVFVAIYAVFKQHSSSRFTMMVDLLTRQDDLWTKDEHMLSARKKAAAGILGGKATPHLSEVLNHFEFIGLLVRRGAIDKEMAWSTFYSSSFYWWQVASDFIKDGRKDDRTVWCDYEYLVNTLIKIEMKKTGKTQTNLLMTAKDKDDFLQHEQVATCE